MTDPFVAEIRVFGFNFPPKGWAFCDGQLLPISQNTALFSLLGTTYGGDGKSTFALPNLQGAGAVSSGQGPGLGVYDEGMMVGSSTVTLLQSEMPRHSHSAMASSDPAEQASPAADRVMARSAPGFAYQSNDTANLTQLAMQALTPAGSSLPHQNTPPVLVVNFCIALQGVFPQRP
ncbi:MAG: phage tail protein [Patulibacter sp.]|nr:phage tail protein [Patulibacter sp.]